MIALPSPDPDSGGVAIKVSEPVFFFAIPVLAREQISDFFCRISENFLIILEKFETKK